jgi:hypothetical protein
LSAKPFINRGVAIKGWQLTNELLKGS